MTDELKTLKDIRISLREGGSYSEDEIPVAVSDVLEIARYKIALRAEAIKWVKKLESKTELKGSLSCSECEPYWENSLKKAVIACAQIEFIKIFFNLSEEDLKG